MAASTSVPNQYAFFDRHVQPWLSEAENRRAFVIISDAFRYEAAQELTAELNGKYRFEAKLVFAAWRIAVVHGAGNGEPAAAHDPGLPRGLMSSWTASRASPASGTPFSKASAEWRASLDELMAMKKDEGREFVKDKRVVYIYHNTVDAIGDDSQDREGHLRGRPPGHRRSGGDGRLSSSTI